MKEHTLSLNIQMSTNMLDMLVWVLTAFWLDMRAIHIPTLSYRAIQEAELFFSSLSPDACVLLTTCTRTIGCNIAWCGWKPNPCTASCKYRKYTNNCRLTSVEVFNYSINWSKQCISNIFLFISGPKPRNSMRKLQIYELQMSDDSHFEFYDLSENGAIYSLAYGRNGFSTKIHIEKKMKYFS